jgi:hypothetical protein
MFTTTRARLAKRLGLVSAVAVSMMALTAGAASAATVPTGPNANTFQSGSGGWTHHISYSGLCLVPGVTCGLASANWVGSGGLDGAADGFLRSRIDTVAGVLSNSRSRWTSPSFTLASKPRSVTSSISVRGRIGALLNIGGKAFLTYHVWDTTLDKQAVDPVQSQDLTASDTFKAYNTKVGLKKLVPGHTYQLYVALHVEAPVATVPVTATVDFDNISLDLQ